MRTLVIGDIHGALKALKQCLDQANYNNREDTLIFLGDYVDGWSESAELVEYLLDLQHYNKTNVFIRGNHDKWCEDWLIRGQCPTNWLMQGGQATVESYVKTGHVASQSHKDFFNNLHNYYIDEDNRGYVHGGFLSDKGLGHESIQSDYYWDRSLWERPFILNSTKLDKHKEIFIGHTSTVNWDTDKPMNRANVWNLDTGAGWYGKLTIMDVDTKEYWQSDLVKELYPDEKGR